MYNFLKADLLTLPTFHKLIITKSEEIIKYSNIVRQGTKSNHQPVALHCLNL